jgi:hypothetical protein
LNNTRFEVAIYQYEEQKPFKRLLKRFFPNYLVLNISERSFDVDITTLVYVPAGMYGVIFMREDPLIQEDPPTLVYIYPKVLLSTRPEHMLLNFLPFQSINIPFPTYGGVVQLQNRPTIEEIGEALHAAN